MATQTRPPFIVRFYDKQYSERDASGRTLDDILRFDDDALEYHHDFVQFLFPLPERSRVNPDAPLITESVKDAFGDNEELRKRLGLAFERMAHFYGFDIASSTGEPVLSRKSNFLELAQKNWLTYVDHNHLRITRILRCLRILGLEPLSLAFYQALQENAQGVSSRSLKYWERAASRPLHLPPEEDNANAAGIGWLR